MRSVLRTDGGRAYARRTGLAACFVTVLCSAVSVQALAAPGPDGNQVVDVGNRKQLFIDERFIETKRGVQLTMNRPVKREIVLRSDESEDGFQFMMSTVLEVDGEYWMYYVTFRTDLPEEVEGFNRHVTRLARSTDGIHWQRIRAGLIDIGKGKDNNIVMTGAYGVFFIDPKETGGCRFWWIGNVSERPEWEESEALYRTGPLKEGGVYLCRSKDGVGWTRVKDPILPFSCDTRNQCFYDARIDKYVAYLRARPQERAAGLWDAPKTRIWWACGLSSAPRREVGPNGLYDGLREELPIVMAADELDPPNTGIYTPNVHVYPWAQEAYLAFPEMYRLRDEIDSHGRDQRGKPGTANEGPLDIALAVSRDGIQWQRFRTPYVPLGRIGQIDGGTMYMGVGMIRKGDEIWQYSTVSPHTHHGFFKRLAGTDGGIRRLVQRLDGFVSADAGYEGGELTTPPLIFKGRRLQINVDSSAMGEVWVEFRDAEGKPIPGYSMAEAVSVDMNGVDQEVWWEQGPDVSKLAGKPIRLHFRMRSAKLFAFQFVGR